VGLTCNYRN